MNCYLTDTSFFIVLYFVKLFLFLMFIIIIFIFSNYDGCGDVKDDPIYASMCVR